MQTAHRFLLMAILAVGLVLPLPLAAAQPPATSYWYVITETNGSGNSATSTRTLKSLRLDTGRITDGVVLESKDGVSRSFHFRPRAGRVLYDRREKNTWSLHSIITAGGDVRELLKGTSCILHPCTSATDVQTGSLSPDGQYVSLTHDGKSELLNTADGSVTSLPSDGDLGYAVSFSPGGKYLSYQDGTYVDTKLNYVLRYALLDGSSPVDVQLGTRHATVTFAPDDSRFASISFPYNKKLRRSFTTVAFRSIADGSVVATTTKPFSSSTPVWLTSSSLLLTEYKKSKLVLHLFTLEGSTVTEKTFAKVGLATGQGYPSEMARVDDTTVLLIRQSSEGQNSEYTFLSVRADGTRKEIYKTTLAPTTYIEFLGIE